MPDFHEMHAAVNRALEQTDYLDFCNNCKIPVSPDSGDVTELSVGAKSYRMWYCDNCVDI